MKKHLNLFKLIMLTAMMSLSMAVVAENMCISVYKEGWDQKYYFTNLSGDHYVCENIVIPNYTGNPNDYSYWVGKDGNWQEGMSANFSLGHSNAGEGISVSGSDYISSCSTGVFSVKVYSGSSDKNYYPHDWTCMSASDCTVQPKGASIPAGTVIFFDNSSHIFSSEVWLSVPSESLNGNSTSLNQNAYKRSNDNWYQMMNIGGDIWQITITKASTYGRMSFWDKDGSGSTDVWQNTVVFQAPYVSGKNIYKPDASNDCRNTDRQTTYYTKGTWNTRSGLSLGLSTTAIKQGEAVNVTLTAQAIGITGTNYVFEKRAFDSDTWEPLKTQTSPSLVISGTSLPAKTTYYRVTYGSTTSNPAKLNVIIECNDGGSAKNLIKYNFGTLADLKGANSRTSASAEMASDYTYQPYGKKINDGYYAVVSTPYYCGCGEGSDMSQTVDQCEGNNMWFRDIKDHTVGDAGTQGNYGGMLMINFDDRKSQIAYEHVMTTDELKWFVKGSTLSFSAYFASAAKQNSSYDVKIKMRLLIQYKATGSTTWVTKTAIDVDDIRYEDYWVYGAATLDIEDTNGDYRVAIENNGRAGTGNDILIDDISLDMCVPTFPVEYYNAETQESYTECVYDTISQPELIRIQKQDYGFGNTNCVKLLYVNDSKAVGEANRYKVFDDLTLSGDYYTTTKTAENILQFLYQTPDLSGKFQVIVMDPTICNDATKYNNFLSQLARGEMIPLASTDVLFSQNMLSFDIQCKPGISASKSHNNPVCEEDGKLSDDLPSIIVEYDRFANIASYLLFEDGTKLTADSISLTNAEITKGKFTIDLNDFQNISRTPGTHQFSILLTEHMPISARSRFNMMVCEKNAVSVSLVVADIPSYNAATWPRSVDYCTQKSISVTAQHTTAYQWYKDMATAPTYEDWQAIAGATSPSYNLPADVEDGARFYVELSNEYCTVVKSSPVVVNRAAVTAPTAENYSECATKTSQIKQLSELVTSTYVKLTWYDETKSQVITNPSFDTSVSTADPVIYYVTDTPSEGCESEPTAVEVWVKPTPTAPQVNNYNECLDPQVPELDLNDLIVNPDPASMYTFYEESGSIEIDNIVDISAASNTVYKVSSTQRNGCESEQAAISVIVKETAVQSDITAEDLDGVCAGSEVTLNVSTATVLPNPVFTWYKDQDKTQVITTGESFTFTPAGDSTLYVSVQNASYCENVAGDLQTASVYTVAPVSSVKLTAEKDNIILGEGVTKTLTVEPEEVGVQSLVWKVNGNVVEAEDSYSHHPYTKQEYLVTVTDECDNTFNVKAETEVEWPTIFTPYEVDGKNDDFVKGVDEGIEVMVFDRSGNMVADQKDGWDGYTKDGVLAMPAVYYYKAILPDGTTKLGTVELYQK